jgi:hypothetical protein
MSSLASALSTSALAESRWARHFSTLACEVALSLISRSWRSYSSWACSSAARWVSTVASAWRSLAS